MRGMATDPPVLDYADPNAGRFVPITQYRSELLVHMAAAKLEAQDIRAVVEAHPRTAGGVRRARIKVLFDDVAAAVSILMETPARDYLLEPTLKRLALDYASEDPRQLSQKLPRATGVLVLILVILLIVATIALLAAVL